MPSPTPDHQRIVQKILIELARYAETRNDNRLVVLADVEFALDQDYRVRPDVLVLIGEQARNLDWNKVPVPGAPDIAIEVISLSERAVESQQKVQAYLQYGTREVWQIYPKARCMVVHKAGLSRTFVSGERVETDLLAGFSLAISDITGS